MDLRAEHALFCSILRLGAPHGRRDTFDLSKHVPDLGPSGPTIRGAEWFSISASSAVAQKKKSADQ